MKKIFRITGKVLLIVLVLIIIAGIIGYSRMSSKANGNYAKLGEKASELNIDGHNFRDLNKNGKLDVYENKEVSIQNRVEDLISQMTIEEKAGTIFINMIGVNEDGSLMEHPTFSDPFSFLMGSSFRFLQGIIL